MTNLFPVAAVLIVERRRCQCCQLVFDSPSEVIHELTTSHAGVDFAQQLARMEAPPPCNGVSARTTRYVERVVQYCQYCWRDTIAWKAAAAIRPAPPPSMPNDGFSGLHVKPGIRPATLDELMA